MPKFFLAEIIISSKVKENFHLLEVRPLIETVQPRCGQFYLLQSGDSYDPLLKRPLSVFNFDESSLQFLFRIKGKGTSYLSKLKPGNIISLIGPLGNGYPEPEDDFIVIAGGIGIASVMTLLLKFGKRAILFYGARNSNELLMLHTACSMAKSYFISTDDGSFGHKGLITKLFFDFIASKNNPNKLPVYSCGSVPMFKTLKQIIDKNNINCYISVEEYMACGVGACLGCVIKLKSDSEDGFNYKRVCKEGPVFNLRDIIW